MNSVTIRPIQIDDVAAAVGLVIGGSYSPEAEDANLVDEYVQAIRETRERRGDVLVAADGDEIIGVCQVLVFQHFQHRGGWCAEIESVHVRENYRSQGIGSKLLETAEEFARSRGCYRIQLTSNNLRVDAHRFYSNNNYVQSHFGFKKSLSTN